MSSQLTNLAGTVLKQSKVVTVLNEAPTLAGSSSGKFAIESDSVLISLYATAITGTLDVAVYTQAGDDDTQDVQIISFPSLVAPTTDLLLKKAAIAMQYIRVVATYTGTCSFVIKAKAIQTGDSSVRILGQNNATAFATSVNTTASVLIPAAIQDRTGIALHNTSSSVIVYMGFSSGEATSSDAWEIAPGEKLGLDVASGVDVYARAATGSIKIKILEAGS